MTARVLVTRPLPDAAVLAADLAARGFAPLVAPMLAIVPVPVRLPDRASYRALAFTSANAVRLFAQAQTDRSAPVFCTGAHTARTARACGWTNVRSAGGDAAALVRLLASWNFTPGTAVLHPCGVDVAAPLAVKGLDIVPAVLYEARPASVLDPACQAVLADGTLAAALFFSPRTARTFANLLEKEGLAERVRTIKALCLADSVVESLEHLPWQGVRVAYAPSRAALLDLLGEGCAAGTGCMGHDERDAGHDG